MWRTNAVIGIDLINTAVNDERVDYMDKSLEGDNLMVAGIQIERTFNLFKEVQEQLDKLKAWSPYVRVKQSERRRLQQKTC